MSGVTTVSHDVLGVISVKEVIKERQDVLDVIKSKTSQPNPRISWSYISGKNVITDSYDVLDVITPEDVNILIPGRVGRHNSGWLHNRIPGHAENRTKKKVPEMFPDRT